MIQIKILENSFKLSGDISQITYKRRVRSNFSSIGAEFEEESILIPFSTEGNPLASVDDVETQYKFLIKLFDNFSIEYSKSKDTNSLIDNIELENENFSIFSLKAKDIRNNIHKSKDFSNFTNVLEHELDRHLYTLQLLSSYHLAFSQNACNFSVPGAGKTSIVYGAYAYLKNLPANNPKHVDRILIISPLAAFDPWKKEYKECFGRETSVCELVGVNKLDRQKYFFSDSYTEITLISYQSASDENDVKSIISFLKRSPVMVVLDEAHKIKNTEGGKWAEAVLSIAKFAKSRVVLTGTPAPNGYQDLNNLYRFIWPTKDIIGYPVYWLQNLSKSYHTRSARQDIQKLIERVSPFFIRIKKSDLDLPNANENPLIVVPMSATQRQIYDYIEDKYLGSEEFNYVEDSGSIAHKLKQAKLIRLMQCATNPGLLNSAITEYVDDFGGFENLGIDDKEIMTLVRESASMSVPPPKFVKIKELVEEIVKNIGPKGKVIIWSIFVKNILDLKDYLHGFGINSEVLYGDVPTVKGEINSDNVSTRSEIIDEFHNPESDFKVIIANPFAVGESISLHKACHNAIYMDKNFNASMYIQSKDRIHRYGLDKDKDVIDYYYFVSEDSIDLKIHDILIEKEEKMLEVIESEDIPLISLNMEESSDVNESIIKRIIKDYHARKSTRK